MDSWCALLDTFRGMRINETEVFEGRSISGCEFKVGWHIATQSIGNEMVKSLQIGDTWI